MKKVIIILALAVSTSCVDTKEEIQYNRVESNEPCVCTSDYCIKRPEVMEMVKKAKVRTPNGYVYKYVQTCKNKCCFSR